MGCGNCGTGSPKGCKNNGGCSTGGCNRMNVHDWLMNLPIADTSDYCNIVEVSFKNGSRKDFFRNTTVHFFEKGDYVTIEGVSGYDVGEVSLTGELVRLQLKKKGVSEASAEMKNILRRSSERDIESFHTSKAREKSMLMRSREVATQLKLQMKLSEIELQADGKKATFFYSAEDRVDFREMIRIFASEFKVKVEMRQIGIRQEAGKVGGIGSCGRELCCSTWLTDFKSVNTTAARYQNLSINQTKLSGQCGRLKCCLNYELDTYLDALQHFPANAESIEVQRGRALLVKKDIFKDLMWYTLPDSNKQYPLTIERVKEIQELNKKGEKPESLQAVELVSRITEVEPSFVDVVGQISLKSLEKADSRKSSSKKNKKGRKPFNQNPPRQSGNAQDKRNGNNSNSKPTQATAQKNTTGNGNNRNKTSQPANRNVNKNRPGGGNTNNTNNNRDNASRK